MAQPSRRTFLRTAGIGAAAVGAVAALPGPVASAAGRPHAAAAADEALPDTAGTLVAYVRDARTGEIALMVGDREVVVSDRALAHRLLRAAG